MNAERKALIVAALQRAIKDNEALRVKYSNVGGNLVEGINADALLLLEAIVAIQHWDDRLIETLQAVWDHGWQTGCADRASHIYTKDYSRPIRESRIVHALHEIESRT